MANQGMNELCHLTIAEASTLMRERALSPVELTQAFLDRIDRLDSTVQAYITVLPESALGDARRAETEIMRGDYRGALHGIPIGLKDIYDARDVLTTAGARVAAHRVAHQDSTAVARLKASGAVLLGKLAMHEFALVQSNLRTPRNPWNPEYNIAGSSSGSAAAVAAGMCMGALGTDTTGSIRVPASHCGVVGLKPTYGRISRTGVVPLSWSLDHCGPITWTVEDAAIMLQAVAGYDSNDSTSTRVPVSDYRSALGDDINGMTIGIPRQQIHDLKRWQHPETLAAMETALRVLVAQGAVLRDVTIPYMRHSEEVQATFKLREAYAAHRDNFNSRPEQFNVAMQGRLRRGASFTELEYAQARRDLKMIRDEMPKVFDTVDLMITPTSFSPPGRQWPSFRWKLLVPVRRTKRIGKRLGSRFAQLRTSERDQADAEPRSNRSDSNVTSRPFGFTAAFNVSGLPAISVPCGFNSAGLPIGLQIVGKHFDEPTVLRAAYAYQRHARWFERRPRL